MKKKQYEKLRSYIDGLYGHAEGLYRSLAMKIACSHSNKLVRRCDKFVDEPEKYEWYCPDCDSKLGVATKHDFLMHNIVKIERKEAELEEQKHQAEKILEEYEGKKE